MTVTNPSTPRPDKSPDLAAPVPQTDRQRELLAVVGLLAEQIGPRPSAGPGERLAAAFMIDRLRRAGYEVTLEPFEGARTLGWTYGLFYGGGAAAGLLGGRLPYLGMALGLSALGGFLAEALGVPTVARLPGLPRGRSANVVARRPRPIGSGAPARRVVLLAHLDTSRVALPFHPRLLSGFRRAFVGAGLALGAGALAAALRPFAPVGSRPRTLADRLGLAAGAFLLAPLAGLLYRELTMPPLAGANDNASGAAVVLVAAEQLALPPPDASEPGELWVVFTGCGAAGLAGMRHFLDAHADEIDTATTLFLNVDSVGAGLPTIVKQEGLVWPWLADAELVATASSVAFRRGLHFQTRSFHTLPTDAQVAMARGYRALTLMGLDEEGRLPNRRRWSDTWAGIAPETLEATLELVAQLTRRLLRPPARPARG